MKKPFLALGILALIVVAVVFFYSQKQREGIIPVTQSPDETLNVEKYVRDNIKTIATNKPVLGGSWYATTVEINVNTKSGLVTYEDGHIQSTATFTYIFNTVSGEVSIENFTLVNKPSSTSSNSGKGFLEGKISIGPLCPVERVPPDPNCQPTAETYKAWPIAIWTADKKRIITQIKPNPDGTYKTQIPAGNYVVDLEKQNSFGVGGNNLPADVSINSGKITILNIDIDTGIR